MASPIIKEKGTGNIRIMKELNLRKQHPRLAQLKVNRVLFAENDDYQELGREVRYSITEYLLFLRLSVRILTQTNTTSL